MSGINKESQSRVGRENQAYASNGSRLVAGGVILSADHERVLMISSTDKRRWIIPKGGVELDEVEDYSKAAIRETWEEAGVDGRVAKYLGKINDHRMIKTSGCEGNSKSFPPLASSVEYADPNNFITKDGTKLVPRSEYHFYEMALVKIYTEWPEKHKRDRHWFDYATAKRELEKNDGSELLEALEKSSIVKD
ncbi:polyphosphatase [Saccharomycopsis crataegensis]|uniref:Polyphosphatase n=1 Tax=Saccharomycopsis crataegensis TaxID=43959 RepID=A0AAV5QVG5_9ASCO|nr:polyphosphatase [Saccharomycopsis crataegensis]